MQFERTSTVLILSLTSALAFFSPRLLQMGKAGSCYWFADIRRWLTMIMNGTRVWARR